MWGVGSMPFPLAVKTTAYTPDTAHGDWLVPKGKPWHFKWESTHITVKCLKATSEPTGVPSLFPTPGEVHVKILR